MLEVGASRFPQVKFNGSWLSNNATNFTMVSESFVNVGNIKKGNGQHDILKTYSCMGQV